MKNRIILAAASTLALILIPGLVLATPTAPTKKKSPSSKSSSKETLKKSSKSSKRSKKSANRSYSRYSEDGVTHGQMVDLPGESDSVATTTSRYSGIGTPETRPLMRVTPQRDGRFLLEPLTPKKPVTPRSSSRQDSQKEQESKSASAGQGYNKFEPWNFTDLILTRAQGYCGAPYRRGSSLEFGSATDCSGFVQYIYHGFKINLPRSSSEQADVGKVVTHNMDFSKMLPGDLLFFRRGGRYVGHAGIYLGEGKMIHASNHRNGVTITDLRQPYYQSTFVVAKRVFEVKYVN